MIDALDTARRHGLEPDPRADALQTALVRNLAEVWQEPDEGIWEVRGERRHFVHSKATRYATPSPLHHHRQRPGHRRAPRTRGRLPRLLVLARRSPRTDRPHRPGPHPLHAAPHPAKRPRPVRRGMGPHPPAPGRQLPAGLHPLGPARRIQPPPHPRRTARSRPTHHTPQPHAHRLHPQHPPGDGDGALRPRRRPGRPVPGGVRVNPLPRRHPASRTAP
ncbi:glycoside hydrolase family 15 protein [Streptomyces sp. NPDC093252]|uniref:glycoside hydrolase family 15 protein n=1 Tax=Streptomyces sp. NPDC093252 TaxID=3154980 RepID=UPI00343C046D